MKQQCIPIPVTKIPTPSLNTDLKFILIIFRQRKKINYFNVKLKKVNLQPGDTCWAININNFSQTKFYFSIN